MDKETMREVARAFGKAMAAIPVTRLKFFPDGHPKSKHRGDPIIVKLEYPEEKDGQGNSRA